MEIKIVKQILEWNEDVSRQVIEELDKNRVCLINVMGSPGAGKTSLITELINRLRDSYSIGVIEGDIAGQIDADRIAAMGIPAVQLQTDGACHIEAMSIQNILPMFDLESLDVIFVENIGNLVCPAEFNIGEDLRISLLSVPEGDDKPLKYPLMFSVSDVLLINKTDVLPYFEFDMEACMERARKINPDIKIIPVCARTGEGMEEWADWLRQQVREWKE